MDPSTKATTAHSSRLSPQAIGGGLALLAFTLDQATKWLIIHVVMAPPRVVELTPFLNLVLGRNTGVVFGIFSDRGDLGRWFLVALAITIVGALLAWLSRAADRATGAALGLVIGGALGNVADRLRLGGVTDFIDLHAAGRHWPTFNLADTAIVVGLVLLVVGERHAARQRAG